MLGARPLRRTIQREIEDTLSERILFQELKAGQNVLVDCEGDPEQIETSKLTFAATTRPVAAEPVAAGTATTEAAVEAA